MGRQSLRIAGILLKILAGIAGVLICLLLLLYLPPVQKVIARKAVKRINENFSGSFSVDRVKISFFNRVKLENIRLGIHDSDTIVFASEIAASIYLSELPDRIIHLRQLILKGAEVNLLKSKEDSVFTIASAFETTRIGPGKKKQEKSFPVFILDRLMLEDVRLRIHNELSKKEIDIASAYLSAHADTLNLTKKTIHVKRVELSGADVLLRNGQQTEISAQEAMRPPESGSNLAEFPWNISLDELFLNKSSLTLVQAEKADSTLKSRKSRLSFEEVNSQIAGVSIANFHYKASVNSLKFIANEEFELSNFKVQTEMGPRSAHFNDILLETPASKLALDAEFAYPDLNELTTNPEKLVLLIEFHAVTGPADLEKLLGDNSLLIKYPEIETEGKLNGELSDIKLVAFSLTAEETLHLALSGKMSHLPDIEEIHGNLQLDSLVIVKKEALKYIPDTLFPETISIPEQLRIQGSLIGSRSDLQSQFSLNSSMGELHVQAHLQTDSIPGKEIFKGEFDLQGFDMGSLLNMPDTLGELTLNGRVEGRASGFRDPEFLAELDILKAEILDYNYRDILADFQYTKESLEGRVHVEDGNVSLDMEGKIIGTDSIPEINLLVNLGHAHLRTLNLSTDSLTVGGEIAANIEGKRWNALHGNVTVDSIYYHSELQSYLVDSINLRLEQGQNSSKYKLETGTISNGDSILAERIDFQANLMEDQASFQYEIYTDLPGKDGAHIQFDGKGNILFFTANPAELELVAEGTGYKMDANGTLYGEKGNRSVKGSLSADSLDLGIVGSFVSRQAEKLRGFVSAEFSISGPLKEPELNGSLQLSDVLIRPRALNTDFSIEDETIEVQNSLFRIEELTIVDQHGNEAVLDGRLNLGKTANSNMDLNLDAENFQLLNKNAASSKLYYGDVLADLHGSATGSFRDPEITLSIAFPRESTFSYIVPQGSSSALDQEGIIVFVDDRKPADSTALNETLHDTLFAQNINNIGLTGQLSLSDQVTLNLVTDPATNDNLQIAGNGDLTFKLNKNGRRSLSGFYEIERGHYRLRLFDAIKREFRIEKGGTLSWTGDLLKARADITAIYELRTSVANLVQDRIAGVSQADLNELNQQVEVKVKMNLKGNLLTPEIDFDIEVDQGYSGSPIEAALSSLNQNESELNKQVFSLLIFNKFSGDIMGDDSMAYGLKNTAAQSLSNLLSEQLNRFADQYIKGFDLSFDIDSYQTGQEGQNSAVTRTDLGVDLSRDLFDDRLTIQVGGRLAVEEDNSEKAASLSAGDLAGDFLVEYRLSNDGTYRLQVFNRTEYENEIDGDISRTGISVIFSKDFVFLNKLFR